MFAADFYKTFKQVLLPSGDLMQQYCGKNGKVPNAWLKSPTVAISERPSKRLRPHSPGGPDMQQPGASAGV